MDAGTIEQTLPGLEQAPLEPALKPGHAIPLTPQKRLMVFSGRSHPALAERIAERLGVDLGEIELKTFAERRDVRRYCESIRGADVFLVQTGLPTGRPASDGAAADDPGREARLREADHGGDPLVPVLAAGPQGEAARADLRATRRRHAPAVGRRPAPDDGPACRPDPGVLHDPRRPHDRAAAVRPPFPRPRLQRRRRRLGRAGRWARQGRRSLRRDARGRVRDHAQDAAGSRPGRRHRGDGPRARQGLHRRRRRDDHRRDAHRRGAGAPRARRARGVDRTSPTRC